MTATKSANIEGLIAPSLAALGYDTVQVRMLSGQPPTLQIFAEPVSGAAMTVDDCTRVSRQVSVVLDVEDPIANAYMLEVSSPGVDRPLVKLADFERFKGLEAKIEARQSLDGRRRFRGRLEGVEGDSALIRVGDAPDDTVYRVPVDGIESAKLVLNDELLKRRKPQED